MINKGIYQHFNGNFYEVIDVVRHSEEDNYMVLYKSIDNEDLYIRSLKIFTENISVNGVEVPKFKYLGEDIPPDILITGVLYRGDGIKIDCRYKHKDSHHAYRKEVCVVPDAVCILSIDCSNNVLLVKQMRIPFGKNIIEFPAGKMNVNETPEDTAIRELREECGVETDTIKKIGSIFSAPGYSTETIYLFIAKIKTINKQQLEPYEEIKVISVDFNELESMITRNIITDAKSIVLFYKFKEALNGSIENICNLW